MQPHNVIVTLRRRGITLLTTTDGKLRVEGVELLTETEKITLRGCGKTTAFKISILHVQVRLWAMIFATARKLSHTINMLVFIQPLKAHKPTLLQAPRQLAEAVDDHQGGTVSGAPRLKEDPWAMATRIKDRWYTPNCNRRRRYHWRSETCQQQGRVEFANTPLCGGQGYQPFAPTLAERKAMAGATGEDVS